MVLLLSSLYVSSRPTRFGWPGFAWWLHGGFLSCMVLLPGVVGGAYKIEKINICMKLAKIAF